MSHTCLTTCWRCYSLFKVNLLLLLLLLFPWARVRLNPSSCVYSISQAWESHREKGEENEQEGHLLMIQRIGPHGGEKVKISHFPLSVYPFITWALYRWEPEDVLSGICCFSAALPSVWHRSPSTLCKNSAESNLTLSNGRRFEFPLWDTGTSWETTTI